MEESLCVCVCVLVGVRWWIPICFAQDLKKVNILYVGLSTWDTAHCKCYLWYSCALCANEELVLGIISF